jgi:Zn-dependent peptidase ImmA (M78 family)
MDGLTAPASALALAALAVVACGERARAVQGDAALREMVRQRTAAVERATGLTFKRPPVVARRSREQVLDYIVRKIDEDLPAEEVRGLASAGRLFGFLPDGIDLRAQLLAVLGEQVAGYYDPDSSTLYVAADVDSFYLRTTVAHELVHALQHQYLELDSLVRQRRQNDRRSAAAAVLEGQATLAQTLLMMPELDIEMLPSFWEMRSAFNEQQQQMKAFARAPLWLRETLIFPYLAGADFVRWYLRSHPGAMPFAAAMPVSSEQILHPDRYAAGDLPTELVFAGPATDTVRWEDGLGEFETRLLFQELLPDASGLRAAALAAGWTATAIR